MQIPNKGIPVSTKVRISLPEYLDVASGSPGPLDKKIPSGLCDRTSLAVMLAGRRITSHPAVSRHRRILCLAPKSIAITLCFFVTFRPDDNFLLEIKSVKTARPLRGG